uniref:Large ribosomal subunit protein bL32c n=1 Tax=Nitellopsis obtusa TaxID=40811 RepID=A0A8F6YEX5_9VIRI|nr:ribosomal protein L32 [Nitellopsis obtusa]
MAVPKKRTSKSKKNIRKTTWKKKACKSAIKAFSLAKSVLSQRSKSFYYSRKNLVLPLSLESPSNE